jgi:hypothetical protein
MLVDRVGARLGNLAVLRLRAAGSPMSPRVRQGWLAVVGADGAHDGGGSFHQI